MSATAIPEDLTKRQREVLDLWNQDKTPTEIGNELGITSQGVHGHLRRLANRGLIELRTSPTPAPARPRRGSGKKVDPAAMLEAVRRTAREQAEVIDRRVAEIDQEIEALREEKRALGKARTELEAHLA